MATFVKIFKILLKSAETEIDKEESFSTRHLNQDDSTLVGKIKLVVQMVMLTKIFLTKTYATLFSRAIQLDRFLLS